MDYGSLLRKHCLSWLLDTNKKVFCSVFSRINKPVKIRTLLDYNLELAYCYSKNYFAGLVIQSMKISKEFKIVDNAPTEPKHGNSRTDKRNGRR